jgi:uncharacterized protein YutE (UPF0331/DUF86 family)
MPIEPDDLCRNKAAIIERSLRRMREEFSADPELQDYSHVDAMTLNIERACQAAIDLALHLVAREHLGMPQSSADAFKLLAKAGHLESQTAVAMVAMTGFRNIVIHEYQALDMGILRAVAQDRWHSLVDFCAQAGVKIQLPQ